MSHDIRTPLNAVIGMTELAQNRIDDQEYVKECLGKISVSGNHLLTLVNDVLEISRVESGRIHINPMPFDVGVMVSGLESITRSQATVRKMVDLMEGPSPVKAPRNRVPPLRYASPWSPRRSLWRRRSGESRAAPGAI